MTQLSGYSCDDLQIALREVGIGEGDTVHMHSALFALGPLADAAANTIPEKVYEAIRDVIGTRGTLTVPAAFEDYARFGSPYDNRRSPVDRAQGVFSQYVAARADSIRTYCPMAGVAGVGPLAQDICHRWTGSAYGIGSAWERLLVHDARLCFLGVRPRDAFTFVMLIQFAFGVPYLYNKLYTVPVLEDGREVPLPIMCAVRYLDSEYRIRENVARFEQRLEEVALARRAKVGRGRVVCYPSARAVFDEGIRMLSDDLYAFLEAPPSFVAGRIPTDGATGPFVPNSQRFGLAE